MVNATDYIKKSSLEKRISVQLVEDQAPPKRKATILPNGFFKEYDTEDKTGTAIKVQKLVLLIDFLGEVYEWTVNKTTSEMLQKEIGSAETEDWTGTVIKFIINDDGKSLKHLIATVISLPPEGGSASSADDMLDKLDSAASERFIRESKSYE